MNDDTRKLLTEYIGECWHHWIPAYSNELEDVSMRGHKCEHCGEYWCVRPGHDGPIVPKTFSTPVDLHAVYSKIVERGEWKLFYWYLYDEEAVPVKQSEYVVWLFCLNAPDQIEERLDMAASFIEERGKG